MGIFKKIKSFFSKTVEVNPDPTIIPPPQGKILYIPFEYQKIKEPKEEAIESTKSDKEEIKPKVEIKKRNKTKPVSEDLTKVSDVNQAKPKKSAPKKAPKKSAPKKDK